MEVTIKLFQEGDRPALGRIYFDERRRNFHWLTKNTISRSSFDNDTNGEHILVAHADNQVAGFVSIWLPDNFIHHLFVDQSYQRRGIGALLLHAAIRQLPSTVTLKCVRQNTDALKFYEKNGWRARSKGVSEDGPYILYEFIK